MNPPWVHMCSPSWILLPPPSPYHPSGSSQCTSPSFLYPTLNLDWQFISHMILYMFQCHSPKSSHPLPLPQSPKDCSIHLCLFCCLAYRVIVTIFLNFIYMCQYTVLALSLFTFMHWRRKWQPTPVFLPAESQGWGSLVGCHLWVAQSWT